MNHKIEIRPSDIVPNAYHVVVRGFQPLREGKERILYSPVIKETDAPYVIASALDQLVRLLSREKV
jgi:hypothetical protein